MRKGIAIKSALGIGALALVAGGASAAPITINSTVNQSGYGFGFDAGSGQFTGLQGGGSYPLTGGTGYDFAGQDYASLTTIDQLTVTLTINDGDSDVDEFDFDNLTLALDGIDTGLKLNGFRNNAIVTLDIQGPSNSAALLAALQADGKLVGTVLDVDSDNVSQQAPEFIGFPADIQTTLVIDGEGGAPAVPLPAAVLMAPLGASLAGAASRRLRRVK
jgi:hypothetical protein